MFELFLQMHFSPLLSICSNLGIRLILVYPSISVSLLWDITKVMPRYETSLPYYRPPTEWRRLFSVVSVRHYVHRGREGGPMMHWTLMYRAPSIAPSPDMRPHCSGPRGPAPC